MPVHRSAISTVPSGPGGEEIPAPKTGHTLLRAAIDQMARPDGWVAKNIFKCAGGTLSQWASGIARPNTDAQLICLEMWDIPLEAWEPPAARKWRLAIRAMRESTQRRAA